MPALDARAPWEVKHESPHSKRICSTPLGGGGAFGSRDSSRFGSSSGLAEVRGSATGLSSFGILLTGRLELRNDLLSRLSLGMRGDTWEERYFVLTRKGLHYYVREKGATDLNGRDLFGLHEGSIAIRSMSQVDVSGDDDHRPLVFTIKTKGLGRDYTLRARSPELFQRWTSTIAAAVDELQHPRDPGSGGEGRMFASRSSSFPRVPSLFDFRAQAPKTDNLTHLVLRSAALGLDVLLETGLPWGLQTTLCTRRHRLRPRDDSLELHLEGGATASIPLRATIGLKPAGSLSVPLSSPTLHRVIKVTWRRAPPAPPHAPAHAAPPRGARSAPRGGLAGGRGVVLVAVALSWLWGRLWPALWPPPPLGAAPLPLSLLPPSLLPPLAVALLLLLARGARRAAAWREAGRAAWQITLAPVPEADPARAAASPPGGPAAGRLGPLPAVPPSPLAHISGSDDGLGLPPGLRAGAGAGAGADADADADADGELQMDALFAAAASAEHSMLQTATAALRRATPAAGAPLRVEHLFGAFEAGVVRVFEALGPSMLLIVRNDQNNLAKLRAAIDAAQADGAADDLPLDALLRHELDAGMHAAGAAAGGTGAALADPSGAMALLWLRRSLEFVAAMLRRLHESLARLAAGHDAGIDASDALRGAYTEVLQPFHSWLLRQTFHLCVSQAPGYADFALAVGPGLGDAERDQILATEMLDYLHAAEPLVHALAQTFAEMRLEDVRKV